MSRRAADEAIKQGRVQVNGKPAEIGHDLHFSDEVTLDDKPLRRRVQTTTVMLNKPISYVCSRAGQGNQTIYELLPPQLHYLKPVGRLDKDSSGLILLTNDGELANKLTHPKYQKQKIYEVELDRPLSSVHQKSIEEGIMLDDGLSALQLSGFGKNWTITMSEGRNRQIRRTLGALDYKVTKLHRTQFGEYRLENLPKGKWKNTKNMLE